MVDSTFRATFTFLDKIGVFDVVLPFLLIFTIVFAMLEKSKIFGTEVVDGKTYTKKNLNSLASFAIAFFAVASSKVVEAITKISANVVVLLVASVFFLLLLGSFHGETDKPFALEKGWKTFFIIVMFIGILLIFLNAITGANNKTWLQIGLDWFGQFSSNVSVAALVMVALMIGAMLLIMNAGKHDAPKTT